MSDTHRYRLESGTFRTRDGERHTAGDVLTLEVDTYTSFTHKFTPVDDTESDDTDETDDSDTSQAQDDRRQTATIPDDWDALRTLASEWDGDEISGRDDREEIESFLGELSDTELVDLKIEAGVAESDSESA
jgi:hypothetical protein